MGAGNATLKARHCLLWVFYSHCWKASQDQSIAQNHQCEAEKPEKSLVHFKLNLLFVANKHDLPTGTPRDPQSFPSWKANPGDNRGSRNRGQCLLNLGSPRAQQCGGVRSSHGVSFSPNLALRKWRSEVILKEYKVSGGLLKLSGEVNLMSLSLWSALAWNSKVKTYRYLPCECLPKVGWVLWHVRTGIFDKLLSLWSSRSWE